MTSTRRSLITGLVSLIAAPAIVRAGSLMPVKALEPIRYWRILMPAADFVFTQTGPKSIEWSALDWPSSWPGANWIDLLPPKIIAMTQP